MTTGDNINDRELLQESELPYRLIKSKVRGKFYVPLKGKFLPADLLMQKSYH